MTAEQRDAAITAAAPALRLWLLLCSDLAMRSGTATKVSSRHYDRNRREFRFLTKAGAALTLPATQAVAELIEDCEDNGEPYVAQLRNRETRTGPKPSPETITGTRERQDWRKLRKRLGLPDNLRPHDFRRATAVAVLNATGDVRDVQAVLGHTTLNSTIWYLDHDLRPVRRSLLETIKRPAWAERKQA